MNDTVHSAPNQPSFSNFPYADAQAQYLDGGALANYGAYPFTFASRADGPPPSMRCPVPLRYSESNGEWYCPTAPCMGPKPHDRAYCDLISGRWVVPSVGGQQPPLDESLVQMSPCEIDPFFPPAIGTRGTVECDLVTGRNYYDLDNGNYAHHDYSGIQSSQWLAQSHRRGRDGLAVVDSSSAYSGGRRNLDPSVSLDRAYTGFHSKGVPFADGRGRLHPAQTAVSFAHHRSRGLYQKNTNVMPVAVMHATPEPRTPRAGYLGVSQAGPADYATSRFTAADLAAVNQVYMRPSGGPQERDLIDHRWNNQ